MARKIGDKDIWVRSFEITETTKHKKGFTVYKVISTVFPRHFPEGATKITAWKRYNDFKKLSKDLEIIFRQLYLKGDFPKFPKDSLFGRFDGEVIEERKKCALKLLEFAASYSQLFTNKVFVKFFETGYGIQDLVVRSNISDDSEEINVIVQEDQDVVKNSACLIPERVWSERTTSDTNGNNVELVEDDQRSLSSFTCSTPEHVLMSPEIIHVNTGALMNGVTSDNSLNPNLNTQFPCASQQPKVRTLSDSSPATAPSCTYVPSTYSLEESRRSGCMMISSASLSEDLDLLPLSEAEIPFNVPNSISCLSLDTLTVRKTLSDYKDVEAKSSSSTTKKKRLNGFGFFDLLPIFAKKQENKVTDEKILAEPQQATYIFEAAGHFTAAHHSESNSEYESAFEAYAEGIRVLLEGAQSDCDQKRKVQVRKKIEKYLTYAESLKEKLSSDDDDLFSASTNSLSLCSPRKKLQGLVQQESSNEEGFVVVESNVMPSSIEELKLYKVIGSTYSNILVAVDGPNCYAVKVLRKSSFPLDLEKPTLIPSTVPFMVNLIKWFNTENCVILVLQYAGGGRLVDFVNTYQTKQIAIVSPPRETSPTNTIEVSALTLNETNDEEETQSTSAKINGESEKKVSTCEDLSTPVCASVDVSEKTSDTPTLILNQSLEESVTKKVQVEIKSSQSESVTNMNGTSFTCPPRSCQPNTFGTQITSLDMDTEELIESSKMLIQNVSRTLQEQKRKSSQDSEETLKFSSLESNDVSSCPPLLKDNVCLESKSIEQETINQDQESELSFDRIFEENKYEVSVTNPSFPRNGDKTSVQNSLEEVVRMVPECCIKVWAAEIVIALNKLHSQGITFGDLDINNILLGESGHIMLSYRALWNEVDTVPLWNDFSAPEVVSSLGKSIWKIHPSADWWSLGAILYFLLTGQALHDSYPAGIYPQTVICIPTTNICGDLITSSAKTLLAELLQYSPNIRLGYYGAEEIRSHPFFEGFNWDSAISDVLKNSVN